MDDVKGLCERLEKRIGQSFDGEATFSDAEVHEFTAALSTLSRELAEARAAYDGVLTTWAESRSRHAAAEAHVCKLIRERDEHAGYCAEALEQRAAAEAERNEAIDRALAAEAASASKDERIRDLEAELEATRKLVKRRAAERDHETRRADENFFAYQEMIVQRDARARSTKEPT